MIYDKGEKADAFGQEMLIQRSLMIMFCRKLQVIGLTGSKQFYPYGVLQSSDSSLILFGSTYGDSDGIIYKSKEFGVR